MAHEPKLNLGASGPVEIIDPDNIPVVFGEVVTELRAVDGIVYISFGNIIVDGDSPASSQVKISCRLRLSPNAVRVITGAFAGPEIPNPQDGQTIN